MRARYPVQERSSLGGFSSNWTFSSPARHRNHVQQRLRRVSYRLATRNAISVTNVATGESSGPEDVGVAAPPSTTTSAFSQAGEAGDWFYTESGQKTWASALELNSLTPQLPQLLAEMGVSYDPERLTAALMTRPMQLTARSFSVATKLGGFITMVLADMASGTVETKSPKRAAQLKRILTELGPSFVKVGQALSSRPDLLPKSYLDALSGLQDRLPGFPTSIAYALIEEELGRPLDEVYSEISPEPVAAASLGQVYKGRLRSTGEEVAIKVQRPGIGEGIALDMVLLRRLMFFVDDNVPQISQPLVPLVDEFAGRLFGELDYIAEGHNAERFGKLYAHVPRVRVPKIIWEGTSRRVLTMEWIEGCKLTDQEAMAKAGLSVVDFVDVGIECTLRQLLEAGFFHADPHPGNLLATKSGDLVYLDFGMMSEAPQQARFAIMAHVVHLVNRDYPAMCNDYYILDFMDPSVDTSPIAPALEAFFDDVLDQSVAKLNFRSIVDGLGGVLFQYPFRVPAYYALILRSLTVLEGLALTADPQYRLLAKAYPYMARRLLTDPAPELRDSFEELILDENGKLRWSRLRNLVEQGSQSLDYDPSQLWLLAEWVCSDGGRPLRGPLAAELVRLADAVITGAVREQVAAVAGGNKAMAERLVPVQQNEIESAENAQLLWRLLTAGSTSDDESSGPSSSRSSSSSSSSSSPPPMPLPRSGPMGIPGPAELTDWLASLREIVSAAGPQLRAILNRPGAQELLANVQWGLLQRFAARSVKFVMGWQGGLSSGSPSTSI